MKRAWLYLLVFIFASAWFFRDLSSMVVEMPVLSRATVSANLNTATQLPQYELPDIVSYQPDSFSNQIYSWQKAYQNDYSDFNRALSYELNKYPQDFFTKANIDNIFIVKSIDGASGAHGFADTASRDIYINAVDSNDVNNPYILSTIHHEIAHLYFIELAGYGVINDSYWQTIYSYEAGSNGSLFPSDGFVSQNAKLSVAEDMAEVFAFMLNDEYRPLLLERLSQDQVLEKKVSYILELNSRFYPDSQWLLPR